MAFNNSRFGLLLWGVVLFELNPNILQKLYTNLEMNGNLLSDFIETLHYIASNHQELMHKSQSVTKSDENVEVDIKKTIFEWLKAISRTSRFSINISFVEEKQRNNLRFLFRSFLTQEQDDLKYTIKAKKLEKLCIKFGM